MVWVFNTNVIGIKVYSIAFTIRTIAQPLVFYTLVQCIEEWGAQWELLSVHGMSTSCVLLVMNLNVSNLETYTLKFD